MVNLFLNELRPTIEALPFVERYGGLAQVAVRSREVPGSEGVLPPIIERFPVSCTATYEDCFSKSKYKDLTPHSSKGSIFFFEDIDGLNLIGRDKNLTRSKDSIPILFQGRVRLIGWFNLKKLGVSNCITGDYLVANIFKALISFADRQDGTNPIQHYQITGLRQVQKSPELIFQKYSMSEHETFFMFPYDCLAIDITYRIYTNQSCIDPFIPETELACITI